MNEEGARYGILFGADMAPEYIRDSPNTAGARFVGIGSVAGEDIADVGLPLPTEGDVWGVVVALSPGSSIEGTIVAVKLRIGSSVEAFVLTDAAAFGNVEAVLKEAHYWELPVAWRKTLARRSNEEPPRICN